MVFYRPYQKGGVPHDYEPDVQLGQNTVTDLRRWLDTLQAAHEAGKCPETIRRWARSGKLRVYRTVHNNRMLFRPDDVRRITQKKESKV